MRAAAIPCTVFVLYQRGLRLPPSALIDPARRRSGLLVCQDRYTAPRWYACLFEDEDMKRETARLLQARLERENAGVRLYGGIEVEDRGLAENRQAWLCTPTVERGLQILDAMGAKAPLQPGS